MSKPSTPLTSRLFLPTSAALGLSLAYILRQHQQQQQQRCSQPVEVPTLSPRSLLEQKGVEMKPVVQVTTLGPKGLLPVRACDEEYTAETLVLYLG
ncbi:hypothetical protein IAT38_002821 [Cryptococcus sp. DSM 104549]